MKIEINENWESVIPSMIACARRKSVRISEFEDYIIQHPISAAEYASSIIRDRWPEAEENILTSPEATLNYARNIIRGRWDIAEDVISSDPHCSFNYAKFVLKGRFEKGEAAIATLSNLSMNYARDILRGRFIAGEATIASDEERTGNSAFSKNYYEMVVKNPSDWASWTVDQLKHSPCWMYMYAKDHMNGRLPDVLHNSMNVFAMNIPDNYYVKRYFKAKKYNKKVKRRKKTEAPINPIN